MPGIDVRWALQGLKGERREDFKFQISNFGYFGFQI
jgi:hypothetical protein